MKNDSIKENTSALKSSKRLLRGSISLALFSAVVGANAAPAPLNIDNVTTIGSNNLIFGLNGDGSIAVGGTNASPSTAFSWTEATGVQSLRFPVTFNSTSANGVSISGNFIAGSYTTFMGSDRKAFIYNNGSVVTQPTGFEDLSGKPIDGYSDFEVSGISGDGQTVIGRANGKSQEQRGFLWSTSTNKVLVLDLPGGASSSNASAINEFGNVVVGSTDAGTDAVYWKNLSPEVLPKLNGGFNSSANDVDNIGNVVVGSASDGANGGTPRAVRWLYKPLGQTTITSLGVLPGGSSSVAHGVSGDGQKIVGSSFDGAQFKGFYWTASDGIRTVEDWLRDTGVTVDSDFAGNTTQISSDGQVVAGYTLGSDQYIAKSGQGAITVFNYLGSLQNTNAQLYDIFRSLRLVLNGSHSHPLSKRTSQDKDLFWVTGDWGTDNHGASGGTAGLAEFGMGRNLGPVQLNIALGKSASNDTIDSDGNYVVVEGIKPLSEDLWGVLTAYHYDASIDGSREYFNAGGTDFSSIDTDGAGTGLRARLEWPTVWNNSNSNLGVFAEASYFKTKIDGYTETGGGFPATVSDIKDDVTRVNIGTSIQRVVNETTNLTGRLELVHQFQDKTPSVSGSIAGLSNFTLGGTETDQTWARIGIGMDKRIGDGEFSLMLNGTTEGEALDTWIAASYRYRF